MNLAKALREPGLVASLCDASQEPLALCYGPEHVLLHANLGLQSLLGQRLAPGRPFKSAAPGLSNGRLHAALDRVFGSGVTEHIELFGGVSLWVAPWPADAGDPSGVVLAAGKAVGGDREQALARREAELARREAELAAREARLGAPAAVSPLETQVLGTVSYELRSALHVLMGYGSLLRRELGAHASTRAGGFLERILGVTGVLGQRVDDLIDLELIGQGSFQLDRKPVAFGQVLEQAAVRVRDRARRKGVQFEVVLPARLPMLLADEGKLGSALDKLLDNAVKFTAAGGLVTLRASAEAEHVACQVGDTGVGIPAGQLLTIFDAFNGAARAGGGLGLGLVLGRAYVEAHGGELCLDSQVGLGTVCSIALPLSPPRSA